MELAEDALMEKQRAADQLLEEEQRAADQSEEEDALVERATD